MLPPQPQPLISSVAPAVSAPLPYSASQQTTGQQPVAHQLTGPVLSLRAAGDGSHQLTITLHPAELGPVNVHVRIVGDSMAIQLASASEGAHDAMREALPQLRHELHAAGLSGVDLSLELGTAGSDASANQNGLGSSGNPADQRGGQRDSASQGGSIATAQDVNPAPSRHDRPGSVTDSGLDRWL
jgi:flagellar hook-length control protein FliK